MAIILVLFAHPRLEQSRAQAALLRHLPPESDVTLRDLYELDPDFQIDIEAEQELLLDHDLIIWQHPLYWDSAPPLLKSWIDLVLAFRWAYTARAGIPWSASASSRRSAPVAAAHRHEGSSQGPGRDGGAQSGDHRRLRPLWQYSWVPAAHPRHRSHHPGF